MVCTGQVHIIAPNIREHVVGLNPLAPLPNTDPAVIAGAMLEAFSRVWGDEDTHKTPMTRACCATFLPPLPNRGLPLAEATNFSTTMIVRICAGTYRNLKNEKRGKSSSDIERLSREPRGLTDFETKVLGPENRLVGVSRLRSHPSHVLHDAAITTTRTLDLLDIMNRGHILLVDLQHGAARRRSRH